ncbi:HPr kinase [Alkaliphilus metalliredigens QYMF]|uniref:HPr kinase/phosphorylase n=1 Tax=Alkaliphilus metalliredigens (strain QYMF) TaxID=293826 RepID=HPRK_ALKMQ|nr:HPr(Ser) kinase/phosphatase [Alkaliphilus metalliredigens]A6TVI5.1 RecName: Full=HPr kinase/phosphorylase; Short=HPrK/P; AltName: Full=HPr(Ser) kinase/phosphorylase [Alkaliphilus metalliredigens QYMF]ABR50203.1 HPr kinase [Alkaliphilus metalliredigens QYMF]
MKSITVEKLMKDLNMEELNSIEATALLISTTDLNRPGMQLAGFFDYFAYERIQIIGKVEHRYLETLDTKTRKERLDRMMSYDIPCLIISRGLEVPEELLCTANKYQRKILRSHKNTTKLISKVINYLEDTLAPTITLHGVLMDIYGVGVLITGKSGIGKSETAVELIKRGHLLVADDAVEIKRIGHEVLQGCAPEIIRHMIEVRGIGILDVKSLFGVGAIKIKTDIDLIIDLEEWDSTKSYDRLGLDDNHREILGMKIDEVTIPIKPARNIALIIEVAARNHRQKKMGYHAAQEFNDRLMKSLEEKSQQ